jgi:Lon protease-like protein
MVLSVHVFEPRYRRLVADLLSAEDPGAPVFGVVAIRQGWEVGAFGAIYGVGTTVRVTDVLPRPDGQCALAGVGERRFAIESVDSSSRPYLMATVKYLPEPEGDLRAGTAEVVRKALDRYLTTLNALRTEVTDQELPADSAALSYAVAGQLALPLVDRQALLACPDTAQRLGTAVTILRRESELLRQLRAVPASASIFRAGLSPS